MSTSARRRLVRDLKKMNTDPPQGINAAPSSENIMLWQAVIFGPDDTPWEGGTFNLVIEFSEDYPNKPPRVQFVSKLFHPNVYADGQICLDILQNQWSPIYDVAAVLTSIQSLLCDPNPNSPANSEAAKLYTENRTEYDKRVRQCVEDSWVAAGINPEEIAAEVDAEMGAAAALSGGEGGTGSGSSAAAAATATGGSAS